jgi:hypothetical protein
MSERQLFAHGLSTKDKKPSRILIPSILIVILVFIILQACGFKVGNVKSVKEATELAINCKTDEALAAVDRAIHSVGFGGRFNYNEQFKVLRLIINTLNTKHFFETFSISSR